MMRTRAFLFIFPAILFAFPSARAYEVNLARYGEARQSSTGWDAPASRAIDGNRSGQWFDGSISSTENLPNSRWEVTLRQMSHLRAIVLWNRTDCCGERLTSFRVSVYGEASEIIWSGDYFARGFPETSEKGFRIDLPRGTYGRTVRIERVGTGSSSDSILALAEVEVFGEELPPGEQARPMINLARFGAARQSSTGFEAPASRAIDGNTSGNWREASLSSTENLPRSWWEVTLRKPAGIRSIVLWNRTDCCPERLSGFEASVMDIEGRVRWKEKFFADERSFPATTTNGFRIELPPDVAGQIVRIERVEGGDPFSHILALAEVQVYGFETETTLPPSSSNIARTGTARQSSTAEGGLASRAIDGETNGDWGRGSVTQTDNSSGAWWEVSLARTGTIRAIVLWNRTDCCSERLSGFRVSVLDDTGARRWSREFFTEGGRFPVTNTTGFRIDLPEPTEGRVVRIERTVGGATLDRTISLAEVEVFGELLPETSATKTDTFPNRPRS